MAHAALTLFFAPQVDLLWHTYDPTLPAVWVVVCYLVELYERVVASEPLIKAYAE